ncbi:MAG TPA: energy transducer TonB [Bryobacteraceae bacterium]|nr:energy transducer TonB [Bryobacteraceae bacterium]
MKIREADFRADASVYPTPIYPAASVHANHAGRVVIEVTVVPRSKTSPLARVESSKVLETPDTDMADAVVEALKDARYMPFFDNKNNVVAASGQVVWEFRLSSGKAEVIDVYAPPKRNTESASQIAANDLRVVQYARKLLTSEAVWNRADNRQCPPNAKSISLYCALEKATLEVTGAFHHQGTVMEDARSALDDVAPHHPNYNHWLMGYNNDPSTTFADIQNILRATEQRVRKRIEH